MVTSLRAGIQNVGVGVDVTTPAILLSKWGQKLLDLSTAGEVH